jgi:hypothetical protein
MSATAGITTGRENGRRRPRGYIDWRPQAKTRALLDQVGEILVEYEDHLPLTVRQVFYRLVGAYGYEKTETAYKRLGDHLVNARRARVIPFESLRDDGVTVMQERWFAEPGITSAGRPPATGTSRSARRSTSSSGPRRLA